MRKFERLEVSPEVLEGSFIATHCTAVAVSDAVAAGIADDSFQVGAFAAAWRYIIDQINAGNEPLRADVELAHGINLPDVKDGDMWREELADRTLARRVRSSLLDTITSLDSDPKLTLEKTIVNLGELTRASVKGHTRYFDADAATRLDRMLAAQSAVERGEFIGIPTGLPIWDNVGNTFRPGDVIAVLGPHSVGKSAMLMHFGTTAYFEGRKKVLLLSPESPAAEVESRLDPMLARKYGIQLSNTELRNGTFDQSVYKRYIEALVLDGRREFVVVDSGENGYFGLNDIVALTQQHDPDVLIVDGFHLIRTGDATWMAFKAAAETLKGLAQGRGLVVIAGSQVQRDAIDSGDPAELGQSAYGLALEEAADKVITLAPRRGDALQRIFKIPKDRYGPKILQRQYLRFDIDRGDIGQLNVDVNMDTGEVDFVR